MNALLILSALVAVAFASDAGSYATGKGYVENDATGNTVGLMGVDQNRDGLPDKADTNRDGRSDVGYGFGRHGYYGAYHGAYHGGYNGHRAYDRRGLTVPVMGVDQNNDGVSDYNDRNRDGKADHRGYGYHGAYAGAHFRGHAGAYPGYAGGYF